MNKIPMPEQLEKNLIERSRLYFQKLKNLCTSCNHEGFIFIPKLNNIVECPCCNQKFQNMRRFLNCNIQPEYLDITLKEMRENLEAEYYKKYTTLLKEIDKVMFQASIIFHKYDQKFFGVSTSGMILVKYLIQKGFDSYVTDVNEIFQTIFNFTGDEDTDKRRLKIQTYFENIPVLMIDNFGTEGQKKNFGESFVYNKFCQLLNTRNLNKRFTIICTDMTKDMFMRIYDGPVLNIISNNFLIFEVKSNPQNPNNDKTKEIVKKIPGLKGCLGYGKSETTVQVVKKPTNNIPKNPKIEEDSDLDKVYK